MGQDINRHLTKEDIRMANKHIKRCSTSYVIREMQIKTAMRYHTTIRMVKIRNTGSTKCWWGCGATESLTRCWWKCKTVQPPRKTVWLFQTKLNIVLQYAPAIVLLSISQKRVENLCLHCTKMFIAALFIIAKKSGSHYDAFQ